MPFNAVDISHKKGNNDKNDINIKNTLFIEEYKTQVCISKHLYNCYKNITIVFFPFWLVFGIRNLIHYIKGLKNKKSE